MQQHPLVGEREVEQLAHLLRVEAVDVAQFDDGPLPFGQLSERCRQHITKFARQQRGLGLGVDRDGRVAPVPRPFRVVVVAVSPRGGYGCRASGVSVGMRTCGARAPVSAATK